MKPIHLSKSIIDMFADCPQRYYFSKVAWLKPTIGDTEAQRRGGALHSAVEQCLTQPERAIREIFEAALEKHGLTGHSDIEEWLEWVEYAYVWAVDKIHRGATILWIEDRIKMEGRMRNAVIHGQFDLVLQTGEGIEVIDWTFGRQRVRSETELLASTGTGIYRMLAGHFQEARPISITEVHCPSQTVLTVTPSDADVSQQWRQVKTIRDTIASLGSTKENFPAQPLQWRCANCAWRDQCPDSLAG